MGSESAGTPNFYFNLKLNNWFNPLISTHSVPMAIPSKSPAQDPAAAEAQVLFEEFFNWRLDRSPEFATLIGIEGHDDKLGQEITKIF